MTEEKENEMFLRYRETGDTAIRNAIAEQYLYIAEIIAKKFANRGVEYDDLNQVAAFALLRGIDRFDPTLGMRFSTFITPTIAGEIKNYFRDRSRLVKLPRRLSEIGAKVKAYAAEYEAQKGVKPSVKNIAAALSLKEDEVVEALEAGGTLSLDSSVPSDDNKNSMYAFLPEEDERFERLEVKDAIARAAEKLSENERKLLKYRYTDGLSQSETAKKLGVSQMFVSRMERKLLSKLREMLSESV